MIVAITARGSRGNRASRGSQSTCRGPYRMRPERGYNQLATHPKSQRRTPALTVISEYQPPPNEMPSSILPMNIREFLDQLSTYDPNLQVVVRIDGFTTTSSAPPHPDLTHCPELTEYHPLASENIDIVWDGNTQKCNVELGVRTIVTAAPI